MITARYETAPEAQGMRPAIQGWRGRQLSTDALYGHLRARDGQGPIASPRRTSLLREIPVRQGSSDRLHVNEAGKHDVAADAHGGVLDAVERAGGEDFANDFHGVGFGVHVGNSGFDSANIGPTVLRVNRYFASLQPEEAA